MIYDITVSYILSHILSYILLLTSDINILTPPTLFFVTLSTFFDGLFLILPPPPPPIDSTFSNPKYAFPNLFVSQSNGTPRPTISFTRRT